MNNKATMIVGLLTELELCEKNNESAIIQDKAILDLIHEALIYYLEDMLEVTE